MRRLNALGKRDLSLVARARFRRRIRLCLNRSRTTRHIKRHRFANPLPKTGSCTDAFPWRGVPLPRFEPRGLAGRTWPSLVRPAALMGFILPYADLIPLTGDGSFLNVAGPTCRSHSRRPPDLFSSG